MTTMTSSDVSVRYCGTIAMISLHTPEAREWVSDNVCVPSWAWMGLGFACEPRLVEDLLGGMSDAGLEVLQ